MKKDFLTLDDVRREEMFEIFDLTEKLKKKPIEYYLDKKTFCLLFEKPSTRTRISFDVGIKQLGGRTVFLDKTTSQLSRGESIEDTVKVLERYVDGIVARVYSHKTLEVMSRCVDIPIVNALSDLAHPCQILSDLFTIKEKFGNFKGLKLAYVGDGNNVCNSLLLGCTKVGMDISVACPKGFEPDKKMLEIARRYAKISKSKLVTTQDPKKAVKYAQIIYTDVWVSMGQEAETEERLKIFKPYQVNKRLVKHADSGYVFMHCLPAHRNFEVTADIIDGIHSITFDQAENRLHSQKGLLSKLLADNKSQWLIRSSIR